MIIEDALNRLPSIREFYDSGRNIALSYSGGLDSTVLLHLLYFHYGKERIKTISFDYGQRHGVELEMVRKNVDRLGVYNKVVDLSFMGDMVKGVCSLTAGSKLKPKTAEENAGDPQINTYVPFRNMIFASIVASFAESNNSSHIALATNQTDIYGYWDTSIDFTKRINQVLELNRQFQVQFISPFVEYYKVDEIKLALELSDKLGYDILEHTWSCYNGDQKECGRCNTCTEKLYGYIQAGLSDEIILEKFAITGDFLKKIKKMLD